MISIKNLHFAYDNKGGYEKFNLDIVKGEKTIILGESGAGKTTLLKILANLVEYKGEILGMDYPVSMVFQNDRLVKNLTVKQNLQLVNKNADIDLALKDIGLFGYENAYIKTLSAGMKRRVAILRAMLFDADIMLLDEPFINLDLKLKFHVMDKIKERCADKTVVLVTHDIKEAVYLADRIIILKDRKIDFDIRVDSQNKEKLENILFEQMLK